MTDVLIVEPYFGGSHQAWAEGYTKSSLHQVNLLTLPGRFWKWRMFGGSLSLALEAAKLETRPKVILASDMIDLASFLGHAGPRVAEAKTVLYMHENQLTYPLSPTARDDLAYAYMNWSSMVRADEIWFNSNFHRDSVFDALPGFLRHFPDHRHTGLVDEVFQRSTVMPVGVDLSFVKRRTKSDPPLVLWNQRWEHDKNPIRMWRALSRLAESGHEFRVAICGENFANVPEGFAEGRERLGGRIVHYGFADRGHYEDLLNDASVVLSTADHEFFGIAVVEAMAAGAMPVLPNELSYPGLLPESVHGEVLYDDDSEMDALLMHALSDGERREQISATIAAVVRRFDWSTIAPVYDGRISDLIRAG